MSLSTTSQLGQLLGGMSRRQDDIASQISPDDANDSLLIQNSLSVVLQGTVTATQRIIAASTFVLDHPVYGYLDSTTLRLDGGYTSGSITMPITMPLEFVGGDIILFQTTF